jgi:hypothetical protein
MKLKSPQPSLRATLSPLGRGEEVVVSSLWLDSIRPQAERYSFLPLPANRGEGWGEGRVLIV